MRMHQPTCSSLLKPRLFMKMATDEEPDYMSDIFVTNVPSTSSTTQKGRSITSSSSHKKSQPKRLQKGRNKKSTASVLEVQVRKDGLSKPLSTDNKGYSLLCKMGYVQGETLGKSGGLVDPLPVSVKEGRQGLGRDEFIKDEQEKTQIAKEKQLEDFRTHCLSQSAQRRLKSDLKRSRQASEHLDTKHGYDEPVAYWYWPSTLEDYEYNDDDDNEKELLPDEEEQLRIITDYLRNEYYYCLWCGIEYTSEVKLLEECPGNSWLAHQ